MYRTDYDSATDVSEQLAVVRFGRAWYVWASDDPHGRHGATIGCAHASKAVAIAHAIRYVERGEYR